MTHWAIQNTKFLPGSQENNPLLHWPFSPQIISEYGVGPICLYNGLQSTFALVLGRIGLLQSITPPSLTHVTATVKDSKGEHISEKKNINGQSYVNL